MASLVRHGWQAPLQGVHPARLIEPRPERQLPVRAGQFVVLHVPHTPEGKDRQGMIHADRKGSWTSGWRSVEAYRRLRKGVSGAAFARLERLDAARREVDRDAPNAHVHDVLEAGVLVGEACEELPNRELRAGGGAALRHAPLWHSGEGGSRG